MGIVHYYYAIVERQKIALNYFTDLINLVKKYKLVTGNQRKAQQLTTKYLRQNLGYIDK